MEPIVKTPDLRFAELEDYPFQENYIEVEPGLKMHYVEEGDPNGKVILLLHGEPSWSYLYRTMIPILSNAGFRVIAPDLIGFGRSDKWTDQDKYTYQSHLQWLRKFIHKMEIKDINLFCQDWGGLLGLRLVAEEKDLYSRIIASNTALPIGKPKPPEIFMKWRAYSQKSAHFDIGNIINMGTINDLSSQVIENYNAPFPSEKFKAGARKFPMLVPVEENETEAINNMKAWESLRTYYKPFLTVFGDQDHIMKGAELVFQKLIPGARGQNHKMLNAGHFIQEEKGPVLAEIIIEFIKSS